MVNIPLDETYSITSDASQWFLSKKYKDRFIVVGHFLSLEDLLKSYVGLCCRLSDAPSIKELIEVHKLVISSLNKALQPLNIGITRGIK